MRIHRQKGFTLIETLVSLLLLGILMTMVGSAISILSSATEQVDDYVTASTGAIYIVQEIQKDIVNNQPCLVSVEPKRLTISSLETNITYEIVGNSLRRNSRGISTIISGEFAQDGDFLHVNITLVDRSRADVCFYLSRGGHDSVA